MSRKKNLSRRKFLGFSSGALSTGLLMKSPVQVMVESILSGIIRSAQAQEQGISSPNFLFFQQPGGPPRTFFDNPLAPNGDGGQIAANPNVGTRYTGGSRYTGIEYATTKYQGLDIPWMWQFPIPKLGGGSAPMTDLAANMAMICGVNVFNPAHDAAQALQFRHSGLPITVNAIAADLNPGKIPAVAIGADNYSFISSKGLASVDLANPSANENLLQTLLNPFLSDSPLTFRQNRDAVQDVIDSAMGHLDALAKSDQPGADAIAKSRKSAKELLRAGFGDLNREYNDRVAAYEDLIRRSLNRSAFPMTGINDKPLGHASIQSRKSSQYHAHYGFGGRLTDANRTINYCENPDMRDMIDAQTHVPHLAQHMAVAEYVLTQELSNSVTVSPSALKDILLKLKPVALPSSAARDTRQRAAFDEHQLGEMIGVYAWTHYYRCIASCLLGFVDKMKSVGKFDETLIYVAGEFGRRPRGHGSDHAAEATSVSLIHGQIKGLQVLGNTLRNAPGVPTPQNPNPDPTGTWGYTAHNPGFGFLDHGHLTSTFSTLLGAPSPSTRPALLKRNAEGKFVSALEPKRIIS